MKLISLYIENFGTLSRYCLEFTDGLTAIVQPNGFGKTTLAEFIRAMFYGFPRKGKTLEKSKRQKYMPWNGGTCGGNLVFEYEGKRFRMERTFGAVPKADTFILIDLQTGRKSDRFDSEIGVQLFGLDSDSFERSIYLPQLQQEGAFSTASIQAKLSDLVEDSSDVGNYDKAMMNLRAARSALAPYRGSGGSVAETAARISEIQLQLDEALRQDERLQQLQTDTARTEEELENVKVALAQVQQKLDAAQEAAVANAYRSRYEALVSECKQIDARISILQDGYPAGFPSLTELSEAEDTADRLVALQAQQSQAHPSQPMPQQTCFEKRVPQTEELEDCRKKCDAFATLQQSLQEAEPALSALLRERELLSPQQPKIAAAVAYWLAAALGISGGIVLLGLKQVFYASAALGIGIVAAAAAVAVLSVRKKRRAQHAQQMNELSRNIETAQQKITTMHRSSEQLSAQIGQFLAEFGIVVPPQHFSLGLSRLEHGLQLFESAKLWQSRKARLEEEMLQCNRELDAFFSRYGQNAAGDFRTKLRRMRDAQQELRLLNERRQNLLDRLAQLEQERPDTAAIPAAPEEDEVMLKKRQQILLDSRSLLTENLLRLKQQTELLREQTSGIPLLRDELERAQSCLTEAREKVRILDETMEFLQQARQSLSTAYLGTIRTRFDGYLDQLQEATGEKTFIDTELQVQLERMGQARELAYFSAGQTDLVMLCMHLALVDALFKEEAVFVILDDPFVNLDDERTAQALRLLEKLSRRRQILYMTCHSSRTV